MATISFTKEMRLNKKETLRLFEFLESDTESTYSVTTPAAKKATKEDLEPIVNNYLNKTARK